MAWFECPHLGHAVELTEERRGHIVERHPDSTELVLSRMEATLREPKGVFHRSNNTRERLFHRSFADSDRRRTVVAIIVTDTGEERSWIGRRSSAGEFRDWGRNG